MLGAVLQPDGPDAKEVASRCLGMGLVVNALGKDVIRLAPSLLVAPEEIEVGVGILGAALEAAPEG